MGDELRAAAERLRRIKSGESMRQIYAPNEAALGPSKVILRWASDESLLAEAWCAEHSADDGEAADRGWLEALPRQQCDTFLWMKKVFNLPQQTKGQVRTLLKALGLIPTTPETHP